MVSLAVQPVQVTAIQYNLLAELAVNAGRVVTHEELLHRVWGPANPAGGCGPSADAAAPPAGGGRREPHLHLRRAQGGLPDGGGGNYGAGWARYFVSRRHYFIRKESNTLPHAGQAVVAGAFSYTGSYVAKRLLEEGVVVRTLTRNPDRENSFGGLVPLAPGLLRP